MSEIKHSPTPWDVSRDHGDCHVRDAEGTSLMCDMQYYPWAPSEEDMGFIVEAVNNHERLTQRVQELEKFLVLAEHKIDQYLQGQYHKGPSLGNTLKAIRAALAGTKEHP